MEKFIHIYTHNDMDGYAGAHVIKNWFNKEDQGGIEIYIGDYSAEPDFSKINKGDQVFIVDYSFKQDKIDELLKLTEFVMWFDHHQSAIDEYEKNINVDRVLAGLRSTKYCGAMLAWLYTKFGLLEIGETSEEYYKESPYWLKLVDAWDTWKEDNECYRNGELLNIAIQNILSMELMEEIAARDGETKSPLMSYLHTGLVYEQYRNQWTAGFDKKYGFETTVKDKDGNEYSAYVLSLGNANSKFFGNKIKEYDICLTQGFDGRGWNVSMYSDKSKDVDVSKICKEYGGGGHPKASGCYIKGIEPPFAANNR